jgi:hypothetical protein
MQRTAEHFNPLTDIRKLVIWKENSTELRIITFRLFKQKYLELSVVMPRVDKSYKNLIDRLMR